LPRARCKNFFRAERKRARFTVVKVTHAEEAQIGDNPHGVGVVLHLTGAAKTATLFVSLDRYDMDAGMFELGNNQDLKKQCVYGTSRFDSGLIMVNGVKTAVSITDLEDKGLASRLTNSPEWPMQ
jgi:hypothetical protein